MAEWFKDWFNTKYYHLLYKDRNLDEARSFIDHLITEIDLPKKAKVVDLACGKGRHAKMLNEHGFVVLGLDLSEESIAKAKELENESLHFGVHDMRETYPENGFDAVFNLFTSFGYFDNTKDNCKVLQAIASYLKPNGLLVIDFMNVKKVISGLVKEETKEIDNVVFRLKRSFNGNHIRKQILVEDGERTMQFEERVQAIDKNRFVEMLEQEGYTIQKVFGNYDLEDFDEFKSDRLIIIANVN